MWGGLDNILFTPNGKLHRYLTKKAFVNLLHPFQPYIVGQRIICPLIVSKFDIPLVMYGENQAEYGNVSTENYIPTMNEKFFSSSSPTELVLGGMTIGETVASKSFELNDFTPYIPPLGAQLLKKSIEVHYLGYYLCWDPQECY